MLEDHLIYDGLILVSVLGSHKVYLLCVANMNIDIASKTKWAEQKLWQPTSWYPVDIQFWLVYKGGHVGTYVGDIVGYCIDDATIFRSEGKYYSYVW